MDRLKNKVALITGGASGIGLACSELFLKEKAFVFIADIDEKRGKKLQEEFGEQVYFIKLNVADEKSWQEAFDIIIKKKKKLDILVNNAGITGLQTELGPQDPENSSFASWKKVHEVNLDGTFLGCKYAIGCMKKTGGTIVNMSSRSGIVGIPGAAAYASSKAAIRNHTKTVALYCAGKGYPIRCNSVHPGAILTPMWKEMISENDLESAISSIAKDIPLKRMGKPEEVAQAILFLASDESSYITGTELTIDGGIMAGTAASPGKR